MKTIMSAEELVLTLSGEHLVTPALIVETIKANVGLWATVKSYGKGLADYERVSETLANYL
jgi:hypothetical protein